MEDELLEKKLEGTISEEVENKVPAQEVNSEVPQETEIHEDTVPAENVPPVENVKEEAPTEPVQNEPTETSTEENPIQENNAEANAEANNPYVKTFTQDDVDKLVGETRVKTREKTCNYFFNKYGVKNEDELDSLIARAQGYDTFKEESEAEKASWEQERNDRDTRLLQMSEEIALMKSGIDTDRYEDAKLILKGKGLEVTLENINNELATHPEWKKAEVKEEEKEENSVTPAPEVPAQEAPKTVTRITTLGNEPKVAPVSSEEEQAEKLFKMKFRG